jgi:hypothetical protein
MQWALRRCDALLLFLVSMPGLLGGVHAAHADDSTLQQQANASIALMTFTVTPDITASNLTIYDDAGQADLLMAAWGGGATVSEMYPVYLEGTIGFSRYDPSLVLGDTASTTTVLPEWTTESASGGIGWDFPLKYKWVVRPIFNLALGTVTSDLSMSEQAAQTITSQAAVSARGPIRERLAFLTNGRLNTVGYGGSVMFDYESFSTAQDIDAELRYSYIHLNSYGDTSQAVAGHADAQNASLYLRRRAPTGIDVWSRPLRYVLEAAHTSYFGVQRGMLGFDALSSVGMGIELDSSKYDIIVTRTRLVARYMFGDNVEGYSLGLAVSF